MVHFWEEVFDEQAYDEPDGDVVEGDLALDVEAVRVVPDVFAGQAGEEGAGQVFYGEDEQHVDDAPNQPGVGVNGPIQGGKKDRDEAVDREHPEVGNALELPASALD